ncbi:DNA cytosine methyltransferase [Helicobacter winghamensis]|uniref:DNA cytosine methyltransferase n=1 Tax=Helicobacter winghamensis TaxID=157268 RepID=UPI00279E40F8
MEIIEDVTTLKGKDFKCDLITAGFPCQDLSVAGKKQGLNGKRSGLFYETLRIADETQANNIYKARRFLDKAFMYAVALKIEII